MDHGVLPSLTTIHAGLEDLAILASIALGVLALGMRKKLKAPRIHFASGQPEEIAELARSKSLLDGTGRRW
jgi:hypothetical protein